MKIIVENSAIYPTKEYVISQIEALLKEAFQNGFLGGGKNVDPNDTRSDIEELVEKHYKNPEEYFESKEEKNICPPGSGL